jgi:hypothetical protein
MAGEEFILMWRWLDELMAQRGMKGLETAVATAREACPNPTGVESWLRMQVNGNGNGR